MVTKSRVPPTSCEPTTHQNVMDQALLQFIQHDELGSEFVSRSSRDRLCCGVPNIDDNIHLKPGTVVEIIGAHGTGKTEILLQARQLLLGRVLVAKPELVRRPL
jgi:RecA/RadA recombinase